MATYSRCDDIDMRTTINLPDDVYELAVSVAQYRRISLGDAIAELIWERRTWEARICTEKGFPYIDIPQDFKFRQVTMEETLRAIDQMNEEEDFRQAHPNIRPRFRRTGIKRKLRQQY